MPDSASAAEAPSNAGMSGVDVGIERQHRRDDLHFVVKPSGNSGRIGRSIRREVSVSFSVGRPSRLKKPPGMRPAAYVFST